MFLLLNQDLGLFVLRLTVAATLLAIVMLGATYYKVFKWKMKFSMRTSTGWEFDLILLAANIAIFFVGIGAWKLF